MRLTAYENSKRYKKKVKLYHDRKLLKREFHPGQQVLLFNSRFKLFLGKLKSKWSGPFTIKDVKPYGAVELMDSSSSDPDRSWIVNGQCLKHYVGVRLNASPLSFIFMIHELLPVKLVTLKKH